ncbi:ABC transporter permease [Virgibacillus sp. 179-BFC.A HS]|uniref:Transport permease protein n=1 Tax=Tigheibacillus jepli TaxID=3035914 RepID=A0ABU5CIS3_9BACI|nr:ABC transporter permease [Virgibacillus sp. 179-BFC.A HS]MDY0405400.1 ABC transporter permease [Virgibacillus sp. 179-BFC.A HS]
MKKSSTTLSYVTTKDFRNGVRFQWRKAFILAENELKAIRNNKPLLVNAFFNPILYLVFFMAGLRGMAGDIQIGNGVEIDFLMFTLPGIFMMLVISLMGHTVYRSTIDKRWGLLGYKFMNGISPLAYVSGLIVYPFLVFIGQTFLLAGLSFFYGLQYSLIHLLLTILMGMVAIVFWCCIGIIITTRVNDYHQRDMVLGLLQLPLLFTAPAFYAIESAPSYIQMIASFNPVTYQVTAIRSIFIGYPDFTMICITVLISTGALLLAILLIRKAELVSREH